MTPILIDTIVKYNYFSANTIHAEHQSDLDFKANNLIIQTMKADGT